MHPEMVNFGFRQGPSEASTAPVRSPGPTPVEHPEDVRFNRAGRHRARCRGLKTGENAVGGRKMPFMDGHYLQTIADNPQSFQGQGRFNNFNGF